jgi:CheY-like chemotaxis protein
MADTASGPARLLPLASDRKCILIVDDNSALRAIVREGLEMRGGYVCAEAVNGLEAIKKAKQVTPDLIILDLAMPELNGFEAATVLRREMPNIPVVILTMYAEALGRSLAKRVGAKAVVAKADGVSGLVECVRGLLDS